MHAHQHTTSMTFITASEEFDVVCQLLPAAQVQVANAERTRNRPLKDVTQTFDELRFDVVVNLWHWRPQVLDMPVIVYFLPLSPSILAQCSRTL
jgi:hypothetical protein